MPRRSAALIGPGEGPKVRTGMAGKVTICGMTFGELAKVMMFCEDGDYHFTVERNGEFDLWPCNFAQVTYAGKNKGFIACVILGG